MNIGFIDYFLDEWHANNYPAWIREASDGEMRVAYAYGMIDSPLPGGMSTVQWCEKYGITPCQTLEELIEKNDALIVLSPDHCHMHEELCQLPLRSGKPTYVDKTFAPDKAIAQRIFAIAKKHNTPCYSTSALRYAAEYKKVNTDSISAVNCWGPGNFDTYSIHQLEPLMMLMKTPAKRVLYLPGEGWLTLAIEFKDGRMGTVSQFEAGSPFITNVCCKDGNKLLHIQSDFFHKFIAELVDFFRSHKEKVSHEETISIMAVRGAGIEAQKHPGQWIQVE